ncbi:MAG: TonB-dependent hemoglobin/transferrin/lactoferrin family receptor [Steroidobacteraceae bacterium]
MLEPMNILRNAIAVALAAGLPTGALAQSPPAGEAAADLETITVYARRLTPVTRVAAVVTVIDEASIAATIATDVKELVRYEPGLTVRSDPFRFGLDSFAVRGIGGNRVAVEIDGIPAAGGFAIGSYSDSGRSFVDLAFVERVEVLRGPASSMYGSDAIGGVVAMTTLQPRSLIGDGTVGVRSETGYASDDEGWHAALIGAATIGPGEALLGYVRRQGNEADTAARVTPDPRDYSSDSLLAKFVLPATPGGPLTLSAEGGRIRQDTSVDAFLGQERFVNTTRLDGDDSAERFRLSLEQRLDAGSWTDGADWRLYWQGTETQQDTYEVRRAAPPRSPAVELDRQFRLEERTAGLEFTALRELAGASYEHGLVYGLEASYTSLDELRDGLQTSLETGATTPTILGETFPLRDFPLTDVTQIGVFLQDEIGPAEGAWTLIPALRADYYRLDSQSDRIYREDNPNATAVGLEEFSLAPKLGVTYAFSGNLTAFVQYAHGFRAPPPEDVNIGLEIPLLNIRALPNPDLKPERSDGYEVGLRWRAERLAFTASAYYNDYRDFIESKVNLGADPDTGVTLFQSQNVAEARIYGAELSADLRAPEGAGWLAGWSARLTAAWSRGDDLVRDEPLNSVDPASAVLALAYDAPSRRWGGRVVTTAVEAKREVDDSRADLYETGGYVTLDLLAHVDLGRGLRLNAGVYNVGDASYIEWSDVRGRTNDDPLVQYYTRPGRNASVTLHWRF